MLDELQRRTRLAQVAELYYVSGFTQSEIAKRFDVSNMQISRLLREAQQLGIVEFKINHPLSLDVELGKELQDKFGLKGVQAVRNSQSSHGISEVARSGAYYLLSILRPGTTFAVPWSSTLALLAQALPYQPIEDLKVVQMLGALSLTADRFNPYDAFNQIGTQLDAEMHPLHAPTLLSTKHARDALVADPAVKSVLDMARNATYAIYGIGTANVDSTFYRMGYLSRSELESLREHGAVGDILGWFFDIEGQLLSWTYRDNLVGLQPAELQKIPTVVAVAAGPAKAEPIRGALNGRYLTHLVTDTETAVTLMKSQSVDSVVEKVPQRHELGREC